MDNVKHASFETHEDGKDVLLVYGDNDYIRVRSKDDSTTFGQIVDYLHKSARWKY